MKRERMAKKRRKDLEFLASERTKELPESYFAELFEIATTKKDVISLGPGEPDFVTPKPILKEFCKKVQEYTHYAPPSGLPALKAEIVKKLRRENRIKAKPENVCVTTGSTEGLLLGLMAIADVTEEVLIPDPGFLAYKPMVEVIDAQATSMPLREETGFQLDIDEIKKIISPKTTCMIINSPSNPTGTVLKKKVLEELAEIAVEHDLMLFSDEAYEHLVYDNAKHISVASLNGMEEYVASFFSFSKSYAMAGFRLGYTIGPEWFIKDLTKLHIYSTVSAPNISQCAGIIAMESGKRYTEEMRKSYAARRKLILKRIDEIDRLKIQVKPEGAFYAFPRYESKLNSLDFCKWLLKESGVVTIPGSEFGARGEGFIRLSYATDIKLIDKAMDKIENALKKLK